MTPTLLDRAREWHRKISLMPNLPEVQEMVAFLEDVIRELENRDS